MIGGNGQQGLPLAGRSKHACAAAPSISAEIAVAHPPRLPSGHGSPARLAEVAGHPAGRLAQPRRSRRWPDGYCKRERCEALVAAKPNPPPFDLGPGMPDVRSGHRTARRPLWAAVQGGLAMTSSDTLDGSNRRRRSQLFLQMLPFCAACPRSCNACSPILRALRLGTRCPTARLFTISLSHPLAGPRNSPPTWALFFCQSPVLSVTCRSSSGERGPALGWTGAQRALRGLAPFSVAIGSGAIGRGFIGKGTRRAGALRVRGNVRAAPRLPTGAFLLSPAGACAIGPMRTVSFHTSGLVCPNPCVLVSPNPCVQETNFLVRSGAGASNWLPRRERMEARRRRRTALKP